jgi:hypothetical protein
MEDYIVIPVGPVWARLDAPREGVGDVCEALSPFDPVHLLGAPK